MPNAANRPAFPKGLRFKPSQRLLYNRFGKAMEQQVPVGVVLADAGYGNGTQFRTALTQLGLNYVVGIESSTTVWGPGQQPLPAPPRKPGRGATPKRLQRNADHQPISVKQLALGLPSSAWKEIALAARQSGNVALSFRRCPGASCSSR